MTRPLSPRRLPSTHNDTWELPGLPELVVSARTEQALMTADTPPAKPDGNNTLKGAEVAADPYDMLPPRPQKPVRSYLGTVMPGMICAFSTGFNAMAAGALAYMAVSAHDFRPCTLLPEPLHTNLCGFPSPQP